MNTLSDSDQATLTPRQREILALLQAGKVNKEVAQELGISVGTVKQHLVTIFRKMNVKNRTMAVNQFTHQQSDDSPLEMNDALSSTQSLLERRPCVVLAIALPETAHEQEEKQAVFHRLVQRTATYYSATLISRNPLIAELVFGLNYVNNINTLLALSAAQKIQQQFNDKYPDSPLPMRASVSAGLLMVSMGRFGDWTEEVLSGTIIGKVRQMLKQTPEHHISIDPIIQRLLLSYGFRLDVSQYPITIDKIQCHLQNIQGNCYGRTNTIEHIQSTLNNPYAQHPIFLIEADSGMGKTRLMAAMLRLRNMKQLTTVYFRALPYQLDAILTASDATGSAQKCLHWIQEHHATPEWSAVDTVIIDDAHLLREEELKLILHLLEKQRYSVLLTTRKPITLPTLRQVHHVTLAHIPYEDMRLIAQDMITQCNIAQTEAHLEQSLALAHGVPKFLRELVIECRPMLTLALITTVLSRFDHLGLDRLLLRTIALGKSSSDTKTLQLLRDQPQQTQQSMLDAFNKNVLIQKDQQHIAFHHPMIQLVMRELFIKAPSVLHQDS